MALPTSLYARPLGTWKGWSGGLAYAATAPSHRRIQRRVAQSTHDASQDHPISGRPDAGQHTSVPGQDREGRHKRISLCDLPRKSPAVGSFDQDRPPSEFEGGKRRLPDFTDPRLRGGTGEVDDARTGGLGETPSACHPRAV